MGACFVTRSIKETDESKAFQYIQDECKYEYGHERDNGTLSTCRLVKTITVKTEKQADKAIEECERYLDKREAACIDMGVVAYRKIQIKKINKSNKPVYRQKYVVQSIDYDRTRKVTDVKSFDTKKEADDYAMVMIPKDIETVYRVVKKPVKVSGNEEVTEFDVKVTESPRKSKGSVPIHQFIFCGWAAE